MSRNMEFYFQQGVEFRESCIADVDRCGTPTTLVLVHVYEVVYAARAYRSLVDIVEHHERVTNTCVRVKNRQF